MTRNALLVAHGQPSDPRPAGAALEGLAAKVQALLPGWQVAAATLAEPGAIARAVAELAPGVVFPMFMAGGWFTRVQIPARLNQAGATGWTVLEPFGCDPLLHDLCVTLIREATAQSPGPCEVILAAHGSSKSDAPANVARRAAHHVAAKTGAQVRTGFIDQHPQLFGMTGFHADAICLPYFAAEGGHVSEDIPRALAAAGFQGRILPPVGADPRVPEIIAKAILRGKPVCISQCEAGREIDVHCGTNA